MKALFSWREFLRKLSSFLRPPEELVIEVKSRGHVIVVQWVVNAVRISDSVLEGFANHREIYFRKETTSSDIGFYEVRILPNPIIGQLLIPTVLTFIVTSPGNYVMFIMHTTQFKVYCIYNTVFFNTVQCSGC